MQLQQCRKFSQHTSHRQKPSSRSRKSRILPSNCRRRNLHLRTSRILFGYLNYVETQNDEMTLCGYVMMFRDENICHPGHNSKQDLSRHFMNKMRDGENREGWVTLFGTDCFMGGNTEDVKNDPIVKDFGFKITHNDSKRIDYIRL